MNQGEEFGLIGVIALALLVYFYFKNQPTLVAKGSQSAINPASAAALIATNPYNNVQSAQYAQNAGNFNNATSNAVSNSAYAGAAASIIGSLADAFGNNSSDSGSDSGSDD